MKFEWETMDQSEGHITYRAWVKGGWLVRNITWQDGDVYDDSGTQSESMVFVPDASHLWEFK